MRRFIAGATSVRLSVASSVVVARSSARPMRHVGDQVGGRRRDDDQVGLAREFDVAHAGSLGRGEQVGADRLAAERLGRQRRDELLRRCGHGDAHRRAALAQPANQVERLIGRDAAANDQQDARARESLCDHASGLLGRR